MKIFFWRQDTPTYQRRDAHISRRARHHLARQRKKERQRLHGREPGKPRGGESASSGRLRLTWIVAFALSVGVGAIFARPLEPLLLDWASPELGGLESMAIQGNSQLSFNDVALATGVERGHPLAEIDLDQVETRLREQPWIKNAHVLRLPPATLVVRVDEREPRALLADTSSPDEPGRVRLVDEEGVVFAIASGREELPQFLGGETLETGRGHGLLSDGLSLLNTLERAQIEPVVSSGAPLTVQLPDDASPHGWVVLGRLEVVLGQKQLEARVQRLVELLGNQEVRELLRQQDLRVDLRFTGQAVLERMGQEAQT